MTPVSISPGVPLYREVRRKIVESVRHGEWKPGSVIPSESRLCERFGVSMGTVRKAVDELSAEGFLVRQQGRGTFVAAHSQDRYLFSFFHIARQDGHKEYPRVDLVEFGKPEINPSAARWLGMEPASRFARIVNRLSLGGEPVLIDEIFLPDKLFPRLTEKKLRDRRATLYQLYQDEFQVTVIRTAERLRAIKADAFKARLLGVKMGDPLLHVIRVALSFRDQPVELRHSYVNTQRYEYHAIQVGGS